MPHQLPEYENTGQWVVQRKFNGTRTVIHISFDRKVEMFSRHGGPHKQFKPSKQLLSDIANLNIEPGKEYWLDGEVMDAKTTSPQYKDKVVLFDILFAGKLLFGKPTLMDRLAMLADICRHPTAKEPNGIALMVTPNLWMAETFDSGFTARFKEMLERDEIEGLVLKKKESVIDNFGNAEYETNWLIRCRKPHSGGNYTF
jgi:ATP-dependent DNA ligase